MAKKTFKIGEYAIGGIITVTVTREKIVIKALHWNTKKVVEEKEWSRRPIEASDRGLLLPEIDFWVCSELTTSYYTDQIINWIKSAL